MTGARLAAAACHCRGTTACLTCAAWWRLGAGPSRTGEAAHAMHSDWHRVGGGFRVRFSLRGERFDAEWSPRQPTRREVKRALERYRLARDDFIQAIADQRGLTITVLELEP